MRWSVGTEETPGGAEGWENIYPTLSQAKPGLVGALTARAEAQVVRLAVNYALWDGSALIGPDHLLAATAVWKYCDASVRYIFGDKIGDPIADTILVALKNAHPQGLTRTEVRDLFTRNAPAGAIATALQELETLGLTTWRRHGTNGGRPAELWTYQP